MKLRLLPILFLSTLLACSKSDSNPEIDFGEGEGITYRTGTNMPDGPADPTDWTSDGNWNKQERNLFPELSFDLNGAQQGLVVSGYAYPNPSAGQATWGMQARHNSSGGATIYTVRAVIVNRKYEVLSRIGPGDFTIDQRYSLDYIQIGMQPDEVHRLYYVVYNASGLVYKGHGDVRYSR